MAIIVKDLNRRDHPSVQGVIKIAEKIIHENKVLDATLLYNRAKKQLKIPRKGLLTIIQCFPIEIGPRFIISSKLIWGHIFHS